MPGVDISIWVGKPPPRDDARHEAGQEEEQESLQRDTYSQSPHPQSVSNEDVSASSRAWGQTHSKTDTPSNGIYIDIPDLSDKENYEHLPGYFTVQRILREVTPGHFLVKLRSGEADLVSMSPFFFHTAYLPLCQSH